VGPYKTASGATRHAVYFGDSRANAYAVDADTGEQIWTRKTDDHPGAASAGGLGDVLDPGVLREHVADDLADDERGFELDLRVGKTIRVAGARTLLAVDVFNVLNSSAVLTYDSTYVPGGAWLQPMTILTPRFFKLTAQVDF